MSSRTASRTSRLNPDDATVTSDTDVAYDAAGPNATARQSSGAAAYTNNFPGPQHHSVRPRRGPERPRSTARRVGGNPSPNMGVLTVVGPLGWTSPRAASTSRNDRNGFRLWRFKKDTRSRFFAINLTNGLAQRIARPSVGSECAVWRLFRRVVGRWSLIVSRGPWTVIQTGSAFGRAESAFAVHGPRLTINDQRLYGLSAQPLALRMAASRCGRRRRRRGDRDSHQGVSPLEAVAEIAGGVRLLEVPAVRTRWGLRAGRS